jgi:dihydropteroate synthase
MGIVNCTPDSFYEGSRYETTEKAVEKALQMWDQGAAIIDIGGASTRPGAVPPTEEEEIGRVIPVIEKLHSHSPNMVISIDTWRHKVAGEAIAAGASMINDVSGGRLDPLMY